MYNSEDWEKGIHERKTRDEKKKNNSRRNRITKSLEDNLAEKPLK